MMMIIIIVIIIIINITVMSFRSKNKYFSTADSSTFPIETALFTSLISIKLHLVYNLRATYVNSHLNVVCVLLRVPFTISLRRVLRRAVCLPLCRQCLCRLSLTIANLRQTKPNNAIYVHDTKLSILSTQHTFILVLLHCCFFFFFYFRCRTADQKSVFGRSCDRPPRHRFFLVSLCL